LVLGEVAGLRRHERPSLPFVLGAPDLRAVIIEQPPARDDHDPPAEVVETQTGTAKRIGQRVLYGVLAVLPRGDTPELTVEV
jgi:hypothetical protein